MLCTLALMVSVSVRADLPSSEKIQSDLREEFHVVPVPNAEHLPGPLARAAFEMTRRETAALRRQLREWEKDSRAKLLTDGRHTEHGIRPNTELMLPLAVVARWSTNAAERAESLADLVAMLRFVAPTHSAGALTASTGKKWQDQWQSALWAYQAGVAAWIVWDRIEDAELRWLVANLVGHEADRFVGQSPPHQIKYDTKSEENAWNSRVIALAATMLAKHPQRERWAETAIRWQLSSLLTEADVASDRVVEGRPLKDWGFGPNLHTDYTLENHDRVHPAYMTVISSLHRQELLYVWAGQRPPESVRFNTAEVYSHLKFLTHPDGQLHYPNGQDWELQRVYFHPHMWMNVLFGDREAAYLERLALESMRRMQARTADGPSHLPTEYFFPSLPHAYAGFYAITFLAHLYLGEGVEPVGADEFEKSVTGVRLYAAGEFLGQRSVAGFASFSWGNRVMGMAIPFANDLLGTPFELGYVGVVSNALAKADTSQRRRRIDVPAVESISITNTADCFGVSATLLRAGNSIEQQIAFVSLDSGMVIYIEQLRARDPVRLETLKTGMIGVYNAPEWAHQDGPRRLVWENGQREIDGRIATPEFAIGSRWVNIDERWGFIALPGGSGWRYEPNHEIQRGRREQFLYLAPPKRLKFEPGEMITRRTTVTLLNHDARSTRELARRLGKDTAWTDDTLTVNLPGWEIVASFGERRALDIQRTTPAAR